MLLRLTTPEAFDRLIRYLEKERNLQWPEYPHSKQSYRDCLIESIKNTMTVRTVHLNIDFYYNAQKRAMAADISYSLPDEILTDEEWLKECEQNDKANN